MSEATLHRALDIAMDLAGPTLTVELSGGEPLLVPGLVRETLRRLRRPPPGAPRTTCRLQTNGLLLDAATVDLLVDHDVALQISCDGPGAQDHQRGGGTFAELDRTLRSILRRHPEYWRRRVGIVAVFTPETVAELHATATHFLALGVRQLALAPVCGQPDWGPASCEVLARQLDAVHELVAAHERRTRGMPRPHLPAATDGAPEAVCGAGSRRSFVVDADGDVHGCAQLARASFAQLGPRARRLARALAHGSIGQAGFADRWRHGGDPARGLPVLRSRAGWTCGGESCRDCPLLDACRVCLLSGQQPAEVPDAHCLFMRMTYGQRRAAQGEDDLVDSLLRAIL